MIAGFKVRINGGVLSNVVTDVGLVYEHTFTGLDDDTEYSIQVRSYDENGVESAYCSAVVATTDPAPPPPPEPVNLALTATVTVLEEPNPVTNPKGAMIDGDRTGGAGPSTGNVYISTSDPGVTPQWVQLDFGEAKSFSEVDIIGSPNGWPVPEPVLQSVAGVYNFEDFKFQYWDGASWVDIQSWTADLDQWRKYFFDPISAQLVRLYVTGVSATAGQLNGVELEVYETGKNPVNIVAMGNSRSQNTDYSWTRKLQWNLNHNYSVKSIAIGGLDLEEILASAQMDDMTDAYNENASDNVVVLLDCVNDFGHSRALVDVQADYTTLCGLIRDAGYKLVIATTAKAISSFVGGANATNLLAMNEWILDNAETLADGVIDVAAQSEFSDPDGLSSGYFPDGTHFSDEGGTVIGDLIYDAISPWYTF